MMRFLSLMVAFWISCAPGSHGQAPLNGELIFRDRHGSVIVLDSVMKMATIGAVEIIKTTSFPDGTMEAIVDFVKSRESLDQSEWVGKRMPYFEALNSNGGLVTSDWIGEQFSKLLLLPAGFYDSTNNLDTHLRELDRQTAIVYLDSLTRTTKLELYTPQEDQTFKAASGLSDLIHSNQCPLSIKWDRNYIMREIRCLPSSGTNDGAK